uniref:No apical meristem-associated C-terminal domain-containing protein n=1 Tax=Tanacetum cinerariifolium TaxID=118510 RepID=A0A699HPF3_TANCI|nr:hypothetical protein [Tanacetum cinerariifolium]
MVRAMVQRPVRLRVRFHFDDDEDDSPVEEVLPVKPKKPSGRAAKAKKDKPKEVKETPKEWTVEEEIVLCQGWKNVEMPNFYQSQGRKKSKTSETTSGSASGGLNLNEKEDEAVEETQKFQPMADKFYNMKQKKWGKKDNEQQSYIELKNRELSIREAEAREIAQLKRKKLEIQRRTLELAERKKWDRDILFYNSATDTTLPPIKQEKMLEMKMEIKTRYNLDY